MTRSPQQRSGFSLVEVIVSVVIFLFSFVAISQLLNICTSQVAEAELSNRAAQLCQSKMNGVISGDVSLSSQSDRPFDEDPDWTWTLECQQDSTITNLWTVHVRVSRKRGDGTQFESTLSQMVIDPAAKGTLEAPPSTSSTPATGMGGGG